MRKSSPVSAGLIVAKLSQYLLVVDTKVLGFRVLGFRAFWLGALWFESSGLGPN